MSEKDKDCEEAYKVLGIRRNRVNYDDTRKFIADKIALEKEEAEYVAEHGQAAWEVRQLKPAGPELIDGVDLAAPLFGRWELAFLGWATFMVAYYKKKNYDK